MFVKMVALKLISCMFPYSVEAIQDRLIVITKCLSRGKPQLFHIKGRVFTSAPAPIKCFSAHYNLTPGWRPNLG